VCVCVITKVSNALNTLVSGEKPGFQTLSKGLIVLLCTEVVQQRVPDQVCNYTDSLLLSAALTITLNPKLWFFNLSFPRPQNFFVKNVMSPRLKFCWRTLNPCTFTMIFFCGICSSQYEYISLKLNNVTFQSRKINGFRENQADIYDRWIELASPKNQFTSPLWGRVPEVEKPGPKLTPSITLTLILTLALALNLKLTLIYL